MIDGEFTATVVRIDGDDAVLQLEGVDRGPDAHVVDAEAVPRTVRREGATVAVVVRDGAVAAVTDCRGATRHWRPTAHERFECTEQSPSDAGATE